jgi:hypothetical protein
VADQAAAAVPCPEEDIFTFAHHFTPILPSRALEVDCDEALAGSIVVSDKEKGRAHIRHDMRGRLEVFYQWYELEARS